MFFSTSLISFSGSAERFGVADLACATFVVQHPAITDLDDAGSHAVHEVPVMAGKDHGALEIDQRIGQSFNSIDIEVVTWFVENEDIAFAK